MNGKTLGDAVVQWADREAMVSGLILIGSQVRRGTPASKAPDKFSDWDFQVITRNPNIFMNRSWVLGLGFGEALAYVARVGRLGSAIKVSIVLSVGNLDLVIIATRQLQIVRIIFSIGISDYMGSIREGLVDLAVVIHGGYIVKKGEEKWGNFFKKIVASVPVRRLSDDTICMIADGFVCDYISIYSKIKRGELLSAQRWLHLYLAEANFQLMHEFRLRCGEESFPDARRLELLNVDLKLVTVSALPCPKQLNDAVERCSESLRFLVRRLLGDKWHWPENLITPGH